MFIKNCPKCNATNSITKHTKSDTVEIRNELINVDIPYIKCQECEEEFYDLNNDENDFLNQAYRKFRSLHNMVQPEEIKEFRRKYKLTQQQMSNLLGWGGATISRYENGALQDEAHDKILHLIMDPKNLKKLIHDNPKALPPEKEKMILQMLTEELRQDENDFNSYIEKRFGTYLPSEFSGFSPFNVKKVLNSILFLCSGAGELKTKLNKLLFYTDFLYFKEHGKSITGAHYVHLPYGPVIDNYEYFLAILIHEDRSLKIEEKECGEYIGEIHITIKPPEIMHFETSELHTLAYVKDYFEDYTASQISSKAHQEKAYRETDDLELISYNFASEIELEKIRKKEFQMSKRKTHHLVPNSEGGWDLKKGGGKRSIKHFDTKAEGEKFGRKVSQNQKSEFVIHKKDGTIQRSDSHGNDPHPPKG